MTGTQDDTIAELQRANAELRRERDAALAQRATEFSERIEHQAATIDVLKAMSSTPDDTQPALNLIARRAAELCGSRVLLTEFDGSFEHARAIHGYDAETRAGMFELFPKHPDRSTGAGRAILERRVIHIPDVTADPDLAWLIQQHGGRSVLAIPLLRDGQPIGVIGLTGNPPGGYSDSQIELLKTFAEQAVIAITSAETYRALQTRTSDLQESLAYQTATSDVLKVISRSTFDLNPVLTMVAETAARLCAANQAAIFRLEGDTVKISTNYGFPPEYEAAIHTHGTYSWKTARPEVGFRAVRERRVVHIPDVTGVSGYSERAIRLGRQRTSLGVPLLREGEPVGVIVLARQKVEPFTDRQIELVSTFADQAVIAIENMRLLTEQQEALAQQTATAEVLQVINASPGDLVPVFDAMLEKAIRLCGSSFGSLATYDGAAFHVVAMRGIPPALVEFFRAPILPVPGMTLYRTIHGEDVVHVADLTDDEVYRSGNPVRRALADLGGARTQLLVALRKDDALLGAFNVFRQDVRPFSDKQIALLKNFAAQAVIAMENVRLLTEQQEALEQQTATAEVLQVINASPGNLAPVYEAMLEKAMHLCGAVFGSLTAWDGKYATVLAMRGYPPALAQYMAARGPRATIPPVIAQLAETRRPQHVADVVAGEGYQNGHPVSRAVADLGGARTILHVPLLKDEAMLGYISVYRQEVRAFSDKQIGLLENFAAQAVIAMDNARLINEQREALEQQTATAEVLQVINASPGNLSPVFEAILNKAHSLCSAHLGALMTFDGEYFRAAAIHGFPEQHVEIVSRPFRPNSDHQKLIGGERLVHILDVKMIEIEPDDEVKHSTAERTNVRTLLAVPLRKNGTLLGFISACRLEVRAFADREIALLENFAAQAVIAMENARLIAEQREALEQQTATAEVLQVINASPGNLAPVFDAILEKAHTLCGFAHGTLNVFDGTHFYTVATYDIPEAFAEVLRRPRIFGPQAPLLRGDRIIHIPDFQAMEATSDDPVSRAAIEAGIRTVLFVALRNERGLLGYLTADRMDVRPFSEKEIGVMESFAAQAVIAMENARLLDEIRQRQAELRTTFDNMGDGVAMFDAELRLAAWNRNFQQMIDLPDNLLAERPSYADYLQLLAERGEFGTADIEAELRRRIEDTDKELRLERARPDGRVIEVRRNAVPGGGFVLIYSDITERKRSEEEIRAARDTAETTLRELKAVQANLIQAEKMASLGQLTAGIAHEIKNPLNFVNNFSALSTELIDELRDVLAPEPLGETARREADDLTALLKGNLEKVVQHGQRADGIVRSMLEHSRGSSSERRTVDLNVLIDEALNLAYHGARAQDQSFNITLERDFGDGIAPIEVNPQDMTRVFLNIFGNGFYATTRRARDGRDAMFVPTLKVTTIDAGEAVEIRVWDNGTGILADIRDKLFQPFFTTKPTGEGTGLGLSITYDIVTQQHGGTITVESEVGEYSEFTIRLPRNP
jgi:PAS domain S-box-containing protein